MVLLAQDTSVHKTTALPARCGESRSMAICASRSVLAGGLRHNQPLLANLCVLLQVIRAAQTHAPGAARRHGVNRGAGRPLRPFPVPRARRGRARGRAPADVRAPVHKSLSRPLLPLNGRRLGVLDWLPNLEMIVQVLLSARGRWLRGA